MKTKLNAKFASNGGKARWRGKSKSQRAEIMRAVANKRWGKK